MTEKLQIAVLDRGWVYIGNVDAEGSGLVINQAKSIRRWGTSNGLGELAAKGPQEGTKLDDYGTVHVPERALIALIDVSNYGAWAAHYPQTAAAAPASDQSQTEQSQTEAA